ncbi:HTH_48 domain-containing protein [Trichonephila clavipes]|nr:HTH_48 domain-containing protein [Trichonephila clavipes]
MLEMIQQAYGRESLSQAQVFRWHKMFKEGRESTRQHEEPQKTNNVPDLAPADFFLFPKGKTALKGGHHGTLDNVKRACTHVLKDISVGDFQGAYEARKCRLQKCVHAQGAYFEDY